MTGQIVLLVFILVTLAAGSFRVKRVHPYLFQLHAVSTATFNQAPLSPPSSSSTSFDLLLEALEIYKDVHDGSIHVPPNYKVPASLPYPSHLHNMSLGRRVIDIRKGKAYKTFAHKKRLDSLGFIWNVSEEKFSNIIKCIHVYRRMYPKMDGRGIPTSYIIPTSADLFPLQQTTVDTTSSLHRNADFSWPPHMRGYKLGASVSRLLKKIKQGSLDDVKQNILLNALGIDRHEDIGNNTRKLSEDDMFQAVVNFRKLHNHLCIPSKFQIPYNSPEWSNKLWGIRLGSRVADVRRGKSGSDKLRSSLRAMGLQPYNESNRSLKFEREKPFEDIHNALVIYKNLYGHLLVPFSFTIPQPLSGTPWENFHLSENVAGMRLGLRVNAIRSASTQRKLSPRVRDSLNSIGFVWKVSEYRFNIFMTCMETFEKKYGHVHVPRNFTIPLNDTESIRKNDHYDLSDDDTLPWPHCSENLPLGRQLLQVKNAKLFTEVQRNRLLKKFPDIQIMETSPIGQTTLTNLSFPDSTPFGRFFRALKAFKNVYGHVYVPLKFSIPSKEQFSRNETSVWPVDCLGYKLGLMCSKIRNSKNGIDFLLFPRRQIKGRSSQFPCGSKHEEKFYIGTDDIESRRKTGMEMLSSLSFRIMSSRDSNFQRICKGLIVHRRLFGDMDVPRYFIVPQGNDGEDYGGTWPAECLGMKLGLRVRDIRGGLTYSEPIYQQILKDIGFFDQEIDGSNERVEKEKQYYRHPKALSKD